MKWCKQINGVQLAVRSDACTSCAKALSFESLAEASLAQEANIEESIATNRGRRIFTGNSVGLEGFSPFHHSL